MTSNQRPTIAPSRRLVALGAIFATLAVTGILVGVLIGNGLNVLLGVLGLGVAVEGAWLAVSTRGFRRALGACVLAIGVGVIGFAVIRAFDGVAGIAVRLLLIVVLLAFTAACARKAVRADIHVDVHPRPAGPPQRPVLLCNPWSGGGKVGRFGIVPLAAQLDVETVMLDHGLDLETLARDAVARGADCLGMAGGDGSQAVVAAIAAEHGLPFVCVGAGTRNHFALDLGLDVADPRHSVMAFRDAYERRVDLATVNDRPFLNNVSLGAYAQMVHQATYRDAKFAAAMTVLPTIIGPDAEPIDIQFTTPDGREVDGAIVLMVSNNPYVVIAAAPDRGERRHLDLGELGVFAVTTRTGAEALRLFAASAAGERIRSRFGMSSSRPSSKSDPAPVSRSPASTANPWNSRPRCAFERIRRA
ncbi:MAG TPA: diacylglycerol kinase family protein [Ilumatobacteraceae bacterium]|nr:diacylglycerol kinase family protein [Ilumatobacteraceae bacterium]